MLTLRILGVLMGPHVPLGERGRRERNGSKLSPGSSEGWGEGVLRYSFIFSLPYSYLLCDKLPFLPKFSLFCP